jgi:hypothetical protein
MSQDWEKKIYSEDYRRWASPARKVHQAHTQHAPCNEDQAVPGPQCNVPTRHDLFNNRVVLSRG